MAKWLNAPVLKTGKAEPQTTETTEVCATEGECLGVLLGALRAESPDLASVVEAWPKLPEAIRAGILAMIDAAIVKRR